MPDQIFISYRRDDAAYVTGHINDLLRKEFGDEAVFTDVDNMALGVDFRAVLDQTVSECQVLLAVIGADWLTVRDQEGQFRLQDPADFVRIEIESALKRSIPVIPLLVSGAKMPAPEDLPESLRDLAFRNGTQIRPAPDFGVDMARLIKNLRAHFESIEPAGDEIGMQLTSDSGRDGEVIDEPSPAQVEQPGSNARDSGVSTVKVQVGEADKARKRAELGIERRKPARGWAGRLWLVAILILAGGSLYYASQNQETIQAVMTAVQTATSETEETIDASDVVDSASEITVGPATSFSPAAMTDAGDATTNPESVADATDDQADANKEAVTDDAAPLTVDGDATDQVADDAEVNLTADAGSAEDQLIDGEVVLTPGSQRQSDASGLISEGVRLAAIGDHEAAIQNFDEAIQLEIEPAFVYKQRGASYQALGQHEAAVTDYDEAIQLNGEDVNAYYNRGASHLALEDYAAAVLDYDAVIQLDPEFVDAYSKRADAHEAMGNIDAATRDRAVVTVFEAKRDNPR